MNIFLKKIIISVFLKEFPETQTRTLSLATLTYLTIQPLPTLHSTSNTPTRPSRGFMTSWNSTRSTTLRSVLLLQTLIQSPSQQFLQLVSGLVSTWFFVSQVIKEAIKDSILQRRENPSRCSVSLSLNEIENKKFLKRDISIAKRHT